MLSKPTLFSVLPLFCAAALGAAVLEDRAAPPASSTYCPAVRSAVSAFLQPSAVTSYCVSLLSLTTSTTTVPTTITVFATDFSCYGTSGMPIATPSASAAPGKKRHTPPDQKLEERGPLCNQPIDAQTASAACSCLNIPNPTKTVVTTSTATPRYGTYVLLASLNGKYGVTDNSGTIKFVGATPQSSGVQQFQMVGFNNIPCDPRGAAGGFPVDHTPNNPLVSYDHNYPYSSKTLISCYVDPTTYAFSCSGFTDTGNYLDPESNYIWYIGADSGQTPTNITAVPVCYSSSDC